MVSVNARHADASVAQELKSRKSYRQKEADEREAARKVERAARKTSSRARKGAS